MARALRHYRSKWTVSWQEHFSMVHLQSIKLTLLSCIFLVIRISVNWLVWTSHWSKRFDNLLESLLSLDWRCINLWSSVWIQEFSRLVEFCEVFCICSWGLWWSVPVIQSARCPGECVSILIHQSLLHPFRHPCELSRIRLQTHWDRLGSYSVKRSRKRTPNSNTVSSCAWSELKWQRRHHEWERSWFQWDSIAHGLRVSVFASYHGCDLSISMWRWVLDQVVEPIWDWGYITVRTPENCHIGD